MIRGKGNRESLTLNYLSSIFFYVPVQISSSSLDSSPSSFPSSFPSASTAYVLDTTGPMGENESGEMRGSMLCCLSVACTCMHGLDGV